MPDRKLAVFGVSMNDGGNSDGEWLKKIDMQDNIAGLPYEIARGEQRSGFAARPFPHCPGFSWDVGMGQFMRISSLP